ncbi:MAG: TraB/GumN family protein [Bacteroidia bacterium]
MKKLFSLFLLFPSFLYAQQTNSLLWEVSGKGIKEPSYIFGTYHLLTSSYVDSLPVVMQCFKKTKAVVGELIIDAAVQQKVMEASVMKDSSLDQLMSVKDYELVSAYFKEQVGMEITLFNKMKPAVISMLFYKPLMDKHKGTPMDIYFQEKGKEDGLDVIGLETADDQIQTLFGHTTLKRQAEQLVKGVKEKDKTKDETVLMDSCYKRGDLDCLDKQLRESDSYSAEEWDQMLTIRNRNWMKQLQALIDKKPVFIAVGAGHLPGDKGILQLLRLQGYTVKVVALH